MAASDFESVSLLMKAANVTPVTENVLIKTAGALKGEQSLAAIQDRKGLFPITERIARAALSSPERRSLEFLLERAPESFVEKFLHDTWQEELEFGTRCVILQACLTQQDAKITDSMIRDYPFDLERVVNYDLDEMVRNSALIYPRLR